MPSCAARARRALPTPDQLGALADVLDTGPPPAPGDGPATLVRLRTTGARHDRDKPHDRLELGALELGDAHPADALVGLDAPPDWLAVGVVGHGRLRALDDVGVATVGATPRGVLGHGRHVLLVARGGAWATRLTRDDGSLPHAEEGRGPVGGPVGLLADACRRALRLPTPPPPADTSPLWAALWLDAVVAAAAGSDALTWAEVAAHHPAARLLRDTAGGADGDRVAAELLALGRRLAQERDWRRLRSACAAGNWPVPGLDPVDAGWFDLGAFARRVLGELPGLGFLRRAAGELLGGGVVQDVDRALVGWGVLDPETGRPAEPW
jgi:hypothetical protein